MRDTIVEVDSDNKSSNTIIIRSILMIILIGSALIGIGAVIGYVITISKMSNITVDRIHYSSLGSIHVIRDNNTIILMNSQSIHMNRLPHTSYSVPSKNYKYYPKSSVIEDNMILYANGSIGITDDVDIESYTVLFKYKIV